ncbi:MAG: DUF3131 domain-containing protein, partial [Acetobacteraceae bacterium]|nr:DUF3131 domain-containing protein [Acetobacteraceae bacterium]
LGMIAGLELFHGQCPNKAYNTISAAMVDYRNQPGAIGCSALDVGRLLIWLRITEQRYPALAASVRAAVAQLHPANMVRDGLMYGASVGAHGEGQALQEGRLGYEQYAAEGFAIWGYDVSAALRPEPYAIVKIYGVAVPYDSRDPRVLGAHNYVVTEGYALDGIEFGWNRPDDKAPDPFLHSNGWMAAAANRLYEAQRRRFERTGILTARTEHQLKTAPYFVYDTVFSDGRPWATITDTGNFVPEFAAVALKGAIGLWALWDTPYTDRLFQHVKDAFDPARGFYEGIFEKGGNIEEFTANNNGIILETLLYKQSGRIYRPQRQSGARAEVFRQRHDVAVWTGTVIQFVDRGAHQHQSHPGFRQRLDVRRVEAEGPGQRRLRHRRADIVDPQPDDFALGVHFDLHLEPVRLCVAVDDDVVQQFDDGQFHPARPFLIEPGGGADRLDRGPGHGHVGQPRAQRQRDGAAQAFGVIRRRGHVRHPRRSRITGTRGRDG